MSTEIGNRLLDFLHQDPARIDRAWLATVTVDEWEAVFALARAHNLDALLAFRLRSHGAEDRLPDAVRETALDARRRGMQSGLLVSESLARLTTALQAGGVPVIVLKGAHLAHAVYPDPSLRRMVDVDLLVHQADLERAAMLLRAGGCRQIAPCSGDGPSSVYVHHLPRFVQAFPPAVELHWRLSANTLPPTNDLWQRALPVRLAGVDTLGLCPEDLLLHVCAHASYAHRFVFGLRPICDITEIVRHFGKTMVWVDVLERARRYRWHRGVYLMLRLAKEMLGAAVPDDVLRGLPSDQVEDALRTARFMVLEGNRISRRLPSQVVSMSSAVSWPGRIRVMWRSLFLPAEVLAANYGLSPRSPRVFLYYPVRLKDLLKRHGSLVIRLLRRDPTLMPIARDAAMIQHWLADDTSYK